VTVPFVDLKRQFRTIEPEIRPAIEGVLESCAFIMGPEMRAFEQEFARYCDVRHCVGVASGTAAIELALRALDIGPGDEVIIPANTYVASALAVTATGASVVLVDVDPVSANIDADVLERAFTPRTKAIMPVHLYGRPADMESILAVARRHGCFVVEDAAQAHGARYRDRLAGGLADIACFSFYPGKNLGAYGDGGAVTTNDPALYDRLILLRDFGQRRKYEHLIKGTNSRLDTLQAAVLSVKLRHLDRWNARRREAAQLYNELLRELPDVAVPDISKECESVFHLYVIEVPDRSNVIEALEGAGVQYGIHYPIPIHRQPAYTELASGSFPVTERRAERILSLPMFGEITDDEIRYTSSVIARAVDRKPAPVGAR